MKVLDKNLIDSVTAKAKESPRLRMNYNLHEHLDDAVHRMFNAMEPGTPVDIHRHMGSDETMILVRGKMKIFIYGDDGVLKNEVELSQESGRFGIHILRGEWHTVEVLESGTVMFEVKDGPYVPVGPEDILKI